VCEAVLRRIDAAVVGNRRIDYCARRRQRGRGEMLVRVHGDGAEVVEVGALSRGRSSFELARGSKTEEEGRSHHPQRAEIVDGLPCLLVHCGNRGRDG
jgi:hypothetical protein